MTIHIAKSRPMLLDGKGIVEYLLEHDLEDAYSSKQKRDKINTLFSTSKAKLKKVKVKDLKEGPVFFNVKIPSKQIVFDEITLPDSMPPLVIYKNVVLDGNHRLRSLRKNEIKNVLVYDVDSITE